LSRK